MIRNPGISGRQRKTQQSIAYTERKRFVSMAFKRFGFVVCLILLGIGLPESISAFYEGKTIRIVVGFSPGGGFDVYARTLARHLPNHIPGNPTVIVQNMPGAGSLIAANHVYKVAAPDGLTMGHFIGSLFMAQVLERPGIEFDARKFEYIGAPARDTPVCVLTKASGITSVNQWKASTTPVKLGGTSPGNTTDDHPNILKAALGLPIQVVSGYKGTAEIKLAAENGEVAGGCWTWDSIKALSSNALQTGEVMVVLQMMPKRHADLPKVPLASDYANTQEGRQLIEAGIHDINDLTRPYVMPPGTPKDLVQVLRKAVNSVHSDPAFLADAKKANLTLDPVTGEEIEKKATALFNLPPSLQTRLKEILFGK
jgi:tripartite-type tricarboxylate transporter receptor subunit TctC